jgi:precorrin-6A/cobalt-precorrin-6A reductase
MDNQASERSLALDGSDDMTFKVLILGGTLEGRTLAERLVQEPRYDTLLSFAGRTASLQPPGVPHRVGGFGGIAGLVAFLRDERVDALVDATHPFAAQMSSHAVMACDDTRTPLIRLERPAWRANAHDRWLDVANMPAAAAALGADPKRVFLSVGRLEIAAFGAAPQHDYLIRAVDPFVPDLPRARVLAARGPFELSAELALLEQERIEVLVSKNSGTVATYAKLAAARALALPVVMVARPQLPAAECAASLDEVSAWLAALHGASFSRRGE